MKITIERMLFTSKGHLAWNLVFVLVQNQINALTNVFGNRNFGPLVQKLQFVVLIFCDVDRGGDFFSVHIVNPIDVYSQQYMSIYILSTLMAVTLCIVQI